MRENTPERFGARDYWRMFLKRGPRLPIAYFLDAHLFDLVHGTDTHEWLPKERYAQRPANFDRGVLYMTSWTREIRRSFRFLQASRLLDEPYAFVDIGCGKGKVCLAWKQLDERHGRTCRRIVGIDYYEPFIGIAARNARTLFATDGDFRVADATTFDFAGLGTPLVAYLYNPFDASVLERVIRNLPPGTVAVYNNPVHAGLFVEQGFALLHDHPGWHPNVQTKIFARPPEERRPGA